MSKIMGLDSLWVIGDYVDTEASLLRQANEQLTIAMTYKPTSERLTEALVRAMLVRQRADRLVEVLNKLLEKPSQ
jgi:hypothetical protein